MAGLLKQIELALIRLAADDAALEASDEGTEEAAALEEGATEAIALDDELLAVT